ncbi:MAG TPA: indole-3-glycerol phosphate synthase TrpC [Polyangia bacterium]|nr:indole-3-glycerol phosphate synthase TrpC [Polyangia bacterium]
MILDEIVAAKRAAHARRSPASLDELVASARALARPRDFRGALRGGGLRVIAEFKRRSPSAGAIRPGADAAEIARAYAQAGAAALSILTDEQFFDGAREHLGRAREACALPLLRKDFLLDERDLAESRLAGADAALLIVRLLDRARLTELLAFARALELAVLVEAHTDEEIERALEAGADVIGVNHRDLDTLAIDLSLSARARKLIGAERILVAESGIRTRDDLARMREHGADAVLIGESLMRAPSPGDALAELLR